MAVAGSARQPRARDFVRLKLRLLGNGLRHQPMRIVLLMLGAVIGLTVAGPITVGLAAMATAPADLAYVVTVFVGSAVVLGWLLVPMLFFGVDETLDPARFALLPVERGALMRGMLAAAFVGVPAPMTLLATTGLGVAAWLRFGAVPGLAALLGVGAGLTLAVVGSRAVTSGFAAMLRSRRSRELAAVLIALLATSIGPLQWAISAGASRTTMEQALRVTEVLAWTPLGAAYALPYDLAHGQWVVVGARAVIVAGAIALLLWWWSRSLESAMRATGSGQTARGHVTRQGPVGQLLPAWLRLRPGPFAAIAARDIRYWWRDSRRRPAIISIVVVTAILPIALNFSGVSHNSALDATFAVGGFSFAVTMAGTMTGMLAANQFGFDGTAFVSHLLARVPGTLDLRARATALAAIIVPVQILVVVAVCALTDALAYVPVGLGVLAASAGTGLGVAALLSVLAPFALPESENPFAINAGGGSAKGLLAFVAVLATTFLSLPITIAAALAPTPEWRWAHLAAGVAYGLAAALLGTRLAGGILDQRAPEILTAVTPRR